MRLDFAEQKPPFLKLLPAFCAGILWYWYGRPAPILPVVFLLAGLCCLLLTLWKPARLRLAPRLGPLAAHLALLGGGAAITILHEIRLRPVGLETTTGASHAWMVVQVMEPPVEKAKSYKLLCEAIATAGGSFHTKEERQAEAPDIFRSARGSILVYLRKSPGQDVPGYGRRLLVRTKIQPIRSSGNPGSFDYAGWSAKRGIFFQAWVDAGTMGVLPGLYGHPWMEQLLRAREWILHSIRRYVPDPSSAAIAQALLIGYRYGIDEELNDAYTRTGVVHIVAISGMHLSMIFGLLAMIPVRRRSSKAWIARNIMIGTVIWLFTLLTGAAASIVRAAVMLSIGLFADGVSRRSGSLNMLLAAAFLMLAANPMTLWDLGFQLSFAAVGGLILFARPLSGLFKPRHPFLRMLWEMQCVSIAAQVLTTPVVLFYFHRFPVLFLLTNMVAIPVSGLVLYVEILFCFLLWWPAAARLTGTLIHYMLNYMNTYIASLADLPFCASNGWMLTQGQTVLSYVLIACATTWLLQKKRGSFKGIFTCMLGMQLLGSRPGDRQQGLVVYQVPGLLYAEAISGTKAIGIGKSSIGPGNGDLFEKHVLPCHEQYHIVKREQQMDFTFRNGSIPIHVTTMEHFLQTWQERKDPPSIVYILLAGPSPPDTFPAVTALCITGMDISYSRSILWRKFCARNGIPLHQVKEEGAFVIPPN